MEIIFGLFWTLVTAIITIGSYSADTVYVNDVPVSQEEFATMLFPKIFLGIFWLIGLTMLFIGIRKIIKNIQIETKGEQGFGKICDIYHNGVCINDNPQYKADVSLYIPSTGKSMLVSEVIGLNYYAYQIGSYVEVKCYNNSINIVRTVGKEELPYEALNLLEPIETRKNLNQENTIVVDGVEYVRKDTIDY